jgi:tetraacyldisaccharide 4'-kinase
MKAPAFWSKPVGWQAILLAPLHWIYGWLTVRRMRRMGQRLPIPVIAIGNLTAGGAGKTPTAMAIAQYLIKQGQRPVFISRGYGGTLNGPVLVDAQAHRASDVGDEPLCLAAIAPTVVARNRAEGAALAQQHGNIILLDDALQNADLAKSITIAVIDAKAGFGNGMVLPAGPLRAPLAAQWPHVDIIVLIGAGHVALPPSKPVFRASLVPDNAVIHRLASKPVLAFAGIGRPSKFFEMLETYGLSLTGRHAFADHHPFSAGETTFLLNEAKRLDAILVTTEKDAARLRATPHGQKLADVSVPVPVVLEARGLMDWIDKQQMA